ncbi:hypothetical protein CU097_009202 [Rhizopus azygosporus]|uniref:GATA-type domain-containing protein n=1 Tax=Rhizopus azygosporus TaxID=86630 RepID=A0A367KFB1_RHIAZ|nr:hypothetical protein CU097_009202 [Rhizopus azygosporus]
MVLMMVEANLVIISGNLQNAIDMVFLFSVTRLTAAQATTQDYVLFVLIEVIKEDKTNSVDTVWNILDLIIYSATEHAVLAFFHNIDFGHYKLIKDWEMSLCCNMEKNITFLPEDSINLMHYLSTTEPCTNTTATIPFRMFQIKEHSTGKVLFTWPPFDQNSAQLIHHVESIVKSMPLYEFKSCYSVDNSFPIDSHTKIHVSKESIACTRHFYASKKMEFNQQLCYFERMVVPYGLIVFESFQVRPTSPTTTTTQQYNSNFIPQPLKEPESNSHFDYSLRPSRSSNTSADYQQRKVNKTPSLPFITTASPSTGSSPNTPTTATTLTGTSLFQKFRIQQNDKPPQQTVDKKRKLVEQQSLQSSISKISDIIPNKYNKAETANTVKICARCRTNNSPEWRRGPDGSKT